MTLRERFARLAAAVRSWVPRHGLPPTADESPFPTSAHMDVRQEDLDALQADWDTLSQDGAAARGGSESQNKGETP